MSDGRTRCAWAGDDPLYMAYHDDEWGVPLTGDRALFEMLILEGFQAGLSWITILRKRENFRRAFDGFDPALVARYDERKIEALLQDQGIVRNRAKVEAAVSSARATLELMDRPDGFTGFVWSFVDGRQIRNGWQNMAEVPAETKESKALSKALKQHGFKFCGPTIAYAFMQACGLVDDHVVDCFRHTDPAPSRR